ncbi:phosphoribosylformylglycinamidine synthase [Candidatus Peregrinibacteria bacterium]|nr:phosphoribosylformylglycinamidine synthase [Candidatus Peregrinibacteria bacterium]
MTAFRLEIRNIIKDTRAEKRLRRLKDDGYAVQNVEITDVYTIAKDFTDEEKQQIGKILINPLFEKFTLGTPNVSSDFDYAIEIGFLPGVTDNLGTTVIENIEDLLKVKFHRPDEDVYSSQITFLKGDLQKEDIQKIAETFANPLIQRIHIKFKEEFDREGGMGVRVPRVELHHTPKTDLVDLEISDEELTDLGKNGIPNANGTRRGPLALSLNYLKAIREYFRKEKRRPTDIEIESIAQTWSEHCKHTIFANSMDEIEDGIYKHYIRRATEEIRKKKGKRDFCVSVFTDNSGAIVFDDKYLVTDKVETHNSPSALDPFGGAVTGIVGVNRDTLGFGKGAKPVANRYGYCFGDSDDARPLYRGKNKTHKALSPRKILEGVVDGVYSGGNESGIPTPQGFVYFEDRYRGKPLVFVGTVGLIPKEIENKPSWKKKAMPGDKIIVAGGAVGLDGIHGATFSSEALDTGSPVTAVQIGDPVTQKKMSDAIVKEARSLGMYNSITDCGAGGISCSVAEMAKECGGCKVELEKVPLKYPNISPWEIWISESQERMTFSVPPEKVDAFLDLMKRRGVEATVIGEYTKGGRCVVSYNGETIMDVDMKFLHDGVPVERLKTTYTPKKHDEPQISVQKNLQKIVLAMLGRKNIASYEFISVHYDHNVQGGCGIQPLQGKGRVNGRASVFRPVLSSHRGVVLSQALYPKYSDIDTYHMAASAIDTAVRHAISVGGNVDYLALLDNFCWCSSTEEDRLGQLKEAARACYETAVIYETPFISGKDSMFNDFKGFDENDTPIKISVPPTLLISAIGMVEDVRKSVTLDLKFPGDLIYILGTTKNELGGSEYFAMQNAIGNNVPKVDGQKFLPMYRKLHTAMEQNLIASAIAPEIGGLAPALLKKAIAGKLGIEIDLRNVQKEDVDRDDVLLFSESQGRFAVSVNPKNKEVFEKLFPQAQLVGKVRDDEKILITGLSGNIIVDMNLDEAGNAYRGTFKNF